MLLTIILSVSLRSNVQQNCNGNKQKQHFRANNNELELELLFLVQQAHSRGGCQGDPGIDNRGTFFLPLVLHPLINTQTEFPLKIVTDMYPVRDSFGKHLQKRSKDSRSAFRLHKRVRIVWEPSTPKIISRKQMDSKNLFFYIEPGR